MIRLSEKYVDRPAAELPLLFQRILSNATMDWFRRQKVRNAVVRNFSDFEGAAGERRRFRHPGNARGPRQARSSTESAAESVSRAQILQLIEAEVGAAAGASTRGLSPALLGGTRRRRDRRLDGLLGRQRQDALLAGRACLGQGPEGEGNRNMNTTRQAPTAPPPARRSKSRFARSIAARLSERAENVAPDIAERLRFAREKALEVGRAGARAAPRCSSAGSGAAIAGFSRSPWWLRIASVAAAGGAGRRPGPDPGLADPLADLGRGRGRRRPARRRPADQRLPRSRFRRIPEGATRRMRRAAMTPGPLPPHALALVPAAIALAAGARGPGSAAAQPRAQGPASRRRRSPRRRPAREDGVALAGADAGAAPGAGAAGARVAGIDAQRKQKWLHDRRAAIHTLPPEERTRITERMNEWARLTPAERGEVRLRYQEARQVPAPDRSANAGRPTRTLPPDAASSSSPPAPPPRPRRRSPRAAASKPCRARATASRPSPTSCPNPALAQPPTPVAPTVVQAAPGRDDPLHHAPADAARRTSSRACRRSRRRPSS